MHISFLTSMMTAVALSAFVMPAQAVSFSESSDGDLSNIFDAPDAFVLESGSNTFATQQQGDAFGRDVDYFTVTVPTGFELTAINLDAYTADPDNFAFLGLAEGSTFPFDFTAPDVGQLLGGVVYGEPNEGNDLLPTIGTLGGAQGFTGALASGDYTFWLNQTGPVSEANFDLQVTVVPESETFLGTALLLGLGIQLKRRRRSQR